MKYTIELATLKEKAQTLEELLNRKMYHADEVRRNQTALEENPDEDWRLELISEYEERIKAIDLIIKLIVK